MAGEGFRAEPPPGTLRTASTVTHGFRLAADHLRHALQTSCAALEVYAGKGMGFFGHLSEAGAKTAVSGINIGVGSLLGVGVLPNLASKLTLLCMYRRRLAEANAMIEEKEAALQKARDELRALQKGSITIAAHRDPKARDERQALPRGRITIAAHRDSGKQHADHLSKMITLLVRERDGCVQARNQLKEFKFQMMSAANNVLEVTAGALRIAQSAIPIGAYMTVKTAAALSKAVPGLGIVTGAFWALYGGAMGVRECLAFRKTEASWKKAKAETSLSDSRTCGRLAKLAIKDGSTDAEIRDALKKEWKTNQTRALLTVEQFRVYRERQSLPQTELIQQCLALRQAVVEKNQHILSIERRRQICKICYYACLTVVGLLGVAAGAAAIAVTGGAAAPVLLALFIPLIVLGGAAFSTDLYGGFLERHKAKVEKQMPGLTSKVKEFTKIRNIDDLGLLADKISQEPEEGRKNCLRAMGIMVDATTLIDKSSILEALTHHCSVLFPRAAQEEAIHLLASFGITNFSSAEGLAGQIDGLKSKNDLLRKLKIKPTASKAKIQKILAKKFPDLFHKDVCAGFQDYPGS